MSHRCGADTTPKSIARGPGRGKVWYRTRCKRLVRDGYIHCWQHIIPGEGYERDVSVGFPFLDSEDVR